MSDVAAPAPAPSSNVRRLVWALVPLLAMAIAIAWLVIANPLRSFNNGAPPVEALTYERTVLDSAGIKVQVRAGGSHDMRIVQMQVDDAYWRFTQEPPGPLPRGSTAWTTYPTPGCSARRTPLWR